jgi:hypothetical protein
MEMEAGLILELWDVVSVKVPVKERQDVAYNYLKTLVDWEVDVTSITDLRDVDNYIDAALEMLDEENGETEDDEGYYEDDE